MDESTGSAVGRETKGVELAWCRLKHWWWRNVDRRIPRLVWLGQEVDVTVTFLNDPLPETCFVEGQEAQAMRPLYSGAYAEMRKAMRNMGIEFDTGMGCGGRDWEWDWSLSGPLRVKFRGRARSPEKRCLPEPKLRLVS